MLGTQLFLINCLSLLNTHRNTPCSLFVSSPFSPILSNFVKFLISRCRLQFVESDRLYMKLVMLIDGCLQGLYICRIRLVQIQRYVHKRWIRVTKICVFCMSCIIDVVLVAGRDQISISGQRNISCLKTFVICPSSSGWIIYPLTKWSGL